MVVLVRGRIADGTLLPGQPSPSGAELSRITGYSTLTCRKALRVLIADGILVPGPSRNARPRIAGGPQPKSEQDLAEATRALSSGWTKTPDQLIPRLRPGKRTSFTRH